MPAPYLRSPPRHLPPEDLEKAVARYRKALASGCGLKVLLRSGRFRAVPWKLLCRIGAEERRNRSRRQAVPQKGMG